MAANIIRNPIRTPEEMAKFLGVSAERLAAVRRIMKEDELLPVRSTSSAFGRSARKNSAKKSAKRI